MVHVDTSKMTEEELQWLMDDTCTIPPDQIPELPPEVEAEYHAKCCEILGIPNERAKKEPLPTA